MRTQLHCGRRVMFGVMAVMCLLVPGVASSQESKPGSAQATMRGMFVVLSSVYAYSLDADAFADPRNRPEILSELEALAGNAGKLEAHGAGLDPSFDFMRRSLSRDAHEAFTNFKFHNYLGAQFVLSNITENCVTCHTKLPAERAFDPGAEFLDAVNAANLPPAARAKLQIAIRQFRDAMETYEEILKSRDVNETELEMFDVFENYLRISIGAMNDAKRPVQPLTEFARRADMPDALKAEARAWVGSLEALNLGVAAGGELPAARRMVAQAREKTKSVSDRSRMVDFIASITLLHRYLHSSPRNDLEVAEAYYLLGVAESYISHSYWVSETDYLLERSIRLAPRSTVARQAFAFLQEYRRSGYYVTPARVVPPEMQPNMEELRKLAE